MRRVTKQTSQGSFAMLASDLVEPPQPLKLELLKLEALQERSYGLYRNRLTGTLNLDHLEPFQRRKGVEGLGKCIALCNVTRQRECDRRRLSDQERRVAWAQCNPRPIDKVEVV
ncbi:hypothetical protein MD484_g6887, partial [Candolleomyces efflorescens]